MSKYTHINKALNYLRHLLLREKKIFLIYTIVVIFVHIFPIIIPIYYKQFIDISNQYISTQNINSGAMYLILFKILGISLINWILRRLFEYYLVKIESTTMSQIYLECFNYVHKHSYRFFSNNFSGSLVKRINRFVDSIESFIDIFSFDVIKTIISFSFIITIITFQNGYLGLLFAIWMILFAILSINMNLNQMKYNDKTVEAESQVSANLADTITNNYNISIFSSLQREYQQFQNTINIRLNAMRISRTKSNIIYACLHILTIVSQFCIFFLAIKLREKNLITAGSFILLISYESLVSPQLNALAHIIKRFYMHVSNCSEMLEILQTPHEIQDLPSANTLQATQGKIEFKNVNFEYNTGVKIFENLNLIIGPGEKVAFVGLSGSGKSTIIKLLFRFFDIQQDQICIDDQDISQVTQESLRKSISLVPQEPILFHRSLLHNIAYANPNANIDYIKKISTETYCEEFINRFPLGYDTLVGERGIKLSGGEKQRIAIARAMIANSKILVLDEATSSLDSQSEYYIQQAMQRAMQDRTTIVIAHRLSTIMKMDRIIVLENGKIMEEGSHNELINRPNGIYQKLWEIQSGGFIS